MHAAVRALARQARGSSSTAQAQLTYTNCTTKRYEQRQRERYQGKSVAHCYVLLWNRAGTQASSLRVSGTVKFVLWSGINDFNFIAACAVMILRLNLTITNHSHVKRYTCSKSDGHWYIL